MVNVMWKPSPEIFETLINPEPVFACRGGMIAKNSLYHAQEGGSGRKQPDSVGRARDPYHYAVIHVDMLLKQDRDEQEKDSLDDIFSLKTDQAKERIVLILGELRLRKHAAFLNFKSLYEDLTRIKNWRLEIPMPAYYLKGRQWTDLNKLELDIRAQIRQERASLFKDTSMVLKDFREALLEYKLQKRKGEILDVSDLEDIMINEDAGGKRRRETENPETFPGS